MRIESIGSYAVTPVQRTSNTATADKAIKNIDGAAERGNANMQDVKAQNLKAQETQSVQGKAQDVKADNKITLDASKMDERAMQQRAEELVQRSREVYGPKEAFASANTSSNKEPQAVSEKV